MNELLLRRRVASAVPYDAEIEYLESTGTQYIYIDCDPIEKIEVEFKFTESVAQQRIIQCGSNNDGLNIYQNSIKNIASSIHREFSTNNVVGARIPCSVILDAPNKITTIRTGIYTGTWANNKTPNYQRGIYIFFGNNIYGKARLYSCKLYKNNALAYELVPVRKNNIGYLYDRVSGLLFANSGTNDFLLGQDISSIHEIEYIEGTGTQFVNTGIYGTSSAPDYGLEIEASYMGGNSVGCLYGRSTYYQLNKTATANQFRLLINNDVFYTYADYANMHKYVASGNELYIDDTFICQSGDVTKTGNGFLFLFARSEGNYATQLGKWRIASCKINMPSGAVDLVPVRMGTEGYFRDKTTGILFRNAGTGSFILGADK